MEHTMYTLVLWKSRQVERKQYVVLIEKEVPNLVLADIVISACRIILMGGHGKDQLLKTSGRRSSLKVKQEERI